MAGATKPAEAPTSKKKGKKGKGNKKGDEAIRKKADMLAKIKKRIDQLEADMKAEGIVLPGRPAPTK